MKTFTGYLGNAPDLSSAESLAVLANVKPLMFRRFHAWSRLSSPSSHLLSVLFFTFYEEDLLPEPPCGGVPVKTAAPVYECDVIPG